MAQWPNAAPESWLARLPGITALHLNKAAASLVIEYDAQRIPPHWWERLLHGQHETLPVLLAEVGFLADRDRLAAIRISIRVVMARRLGRNISSSITAAVIPPATDRRRRRKDTIRRVTVPTTGTMLTRPITTAAWAAFSTSATSGSSRARSPARP